MKIPVLTMREAEALPAWRGPVALLMVMAVAMPIAFSVWVALLNNFVIERAAFTGVEIGWLQTVREIPGFLAVGVIAVLLFMREQVLAVVSLILLGGATAVTAMFPSFQGLLMTTLIGSIGFHYFATVHQSLQLQWLEKDRAPVVIGRLIGVGSAASLLAYGLIIAFWTMLDVSYSTIYMIAGLTTVGLALFCLAAYRQFEAPTPQRTEIVLRRRYWLYYALEFMSGARRQIFVVFAAFMMVERFGFTVPQITALYMVTFAANIFAAPAIGRFVAGFGERTALTIEYIGLLGVFLAYGGVYIFEWGAEIGAALYIIDHLLFALALSLRTYFQKISDPADIAPTAAVAFTINHIAAVFLPAALGYLWIVSPPAVFILAAFMAATSLVLARLIPRNPAEGAETVFTAKHEPVPSAAE